MTVERTETAGGLKFVVKRPGEPGIVIPVKHLPAKSMVFITGKNPTTEFASRDLAEQFAEELARECDSRLGANPDHSSAQIEAYTRAVEDEVWVSVSRSWKNRPA